LNQERWFRNISESLINIRSTIYTLKITENKRQLVYVNDIFVGTNPLILENGVVISPSTITINNLNESFFLIEAPKTLVLEASKSLLIEAPKANFEMIIALGDGTNNYPQIVSPKQNVSLIELPSIDVNSPDD